jgi:hypothetical protein
MKRLLLSIVIFLISRQSFAKDPYSTLLDACLKDSRVEFCNNMNNMKDTTQKAAERYLLSVGLYNASVFVGSFIQASLNQRVEIRDNSRISYLGNQRALILRPDQVLIVITWPID